MHHQNGNVDLLQILGEVGLREGDDAVIVSLGAAHHALPPPVLDDAFGWFRARPVIPVERSGRQVAIELRAVGRRLRLQSVEHVFRQAAGIRCRLHHQRRDSGDDGGFCDPAFAVACDVVHHFTVAGGVADMHRVFQIEMRGQRGQIVSVVIHVVAVGHLGGAAVPAAIVGDDSIALAEEKQHLRVPVVRRQRPAVTENDRLSRAPVLVENLNAVFGFNRRHIRFVLSASRERAG